MGVSTADNILRAAYSMEYSISVSGISRSACESPVIQRPMYEVSRGPQIRILLLHPSIPVCMLFSCLGEAMRSLQCHSATPALQSRADHQHLALFCGAVEPCLFKAEPGPIVSGACTAPLNGAAIRESSHDRASGGDTWYLLYRVLAASQDCSGFGGETSEGWPCDYGSPFAVLAPTVERAIAFGASTHPVVVSMPGIPCEGAETEKPKNFPLGEALSTDCM